MAFCVIVLVRCFVFPHLGAAFYLYVSDLDKQNIFEQRQQIKLRSSKYFRTRLIGILVTIIKFVGFELIYYTINLVDVSSFTVFSDLISYFLWMYC